MLNPTDQPFALPVSPFFDRFYS